MSQENLCPCGSGKEFDACCGEIIRGARKAATPEELMRARYSAYAKSEIDFLVDSTHPSKREENDKAELEKWSRNSKWLGLEIMKTEQGGTEDQVGFVEFTASYEDRGVHIDHHEYSEFRRDKGEWFFYDGKIVGEKPFVREEPKIGRNDPCPCGSGKKYKKCCGR